MFIIFECMLSPWQLQKQYLAFQLQVLVLQFCYGSVLVSSLNSVYSHRMYHHLNLLSLYLCLSCKHFCPSFFLLYEVFFSWLSVVITISLLSSLCVASTWPTLLERAALIDSTSLPGVGDIFGSLMTLTNTSFSALLGTGFLECYGVRQGGQSEHR